MEKKPAMDGATVSPLAGARAHLRWMRHRRAEPRWRAKRGPSAHPRNGGSAAKTSRTPPLPRRRSGSGDEKEHHKYLANNPDYIRQGVNLSQFSFAIPKPLHEVNVQKRIGEAHELPELAEAAEVDPLCWAAPPTRRELLREPGSSSSVHVDLHQPEVSGHAHLHQPEASESPAPVPKKRTVKQVLSTKYRRTPPTANSLFRNQGSSNDIEHVLL